MKQNKWILLSLIGTFLGTCCLLFFIFNPLSLNSSHKKKITLPVNTVERASTTINTNPPINPPVRQKPQTTSLKKKTDPTKKTQPESKLIFGIDTANVYTPTVSKCVAATYDKPKVIGRYLQTKSGFFSGLTKNEVQFVHQKGAKILPIYNNYTNFIGANQGERSAKEAIGKAKQLGLPKGKVIAIDIEPKRQINADFIVSWTKTLQNSGYKAGIYGNFADPNLRSIYLEARHKSPSMKQVIIWTNSPNEGTLHKPTSFKGKSPYLTNTLIWQYGINQPCHIDSDFVKVNLLKNLW
jgi:hypothetical protein